MLWLFLGWFGTHRFFMKKYKSALIMLVITIISFLIHSELFLYIFARIGMIFTAGAPFSVMILAIPLYSLAFLTSPLIIVIIWWFIDLFIIFKYINNSDDV